MSETQFSEFQSFVEAGMTRRRVPGVAIGLFHDGIEHTAAFGVTNVDNPLPVDADTLFQVGSITKTFAATAAFVGRELAVGAVNWVMERLVGVSRPRTPVVPVPGHVLDGCVGL